MKISVTLKDPDGFSEAVDDALAASLEGSGLPQDEQDAVLEKREEKLWQVLGRWVDCKEYIEIDFDTEAGTATVRPRA
jgi:hypothetical protein